ncbi:DUF6529 family protein [Pseudonocardia sp. NPDC046786]|uniref:DUF6529 family protein n=1 Tax=Pseudonocardia sp. NPDC046786 TaxID=3155471 RepID=UPI0033F69B4C
MGRGARHADHETTDPFGFAPIVPNPRTPEDSGGSAPVGPAPREWLEPVPPPPRRRARRPRPRAARPDPARDDRWSPGPPGDADRRAGTAGRRRANAPGELFEPYGRSAPPGYPADDRADPRSRTGEQEPVGDPPRRPARDAGAVAPGRPSRDAGHERSPAGSGSRRRTGAAGGHRGPGPAATGLAERPAGPAAATDTATDTATDAATDTALDPRGPVGPSLRAVILPVVIGSLVAVALGVWARQHEGTGVAVNLAGFSSGAAAKAWLGSAALLLAILQGVTGRMLRRGYADPSVATVHRWSGRIAVLVTVPVAAQCLYAFGWSGATPSVLLHSVLGCVFYGAFVTKMLLLHRRGVPGWALAVAGGVLLAVLAGVWLTSALWFFTGQGLVF